MKKFLAVFFLALIAAVFFLRTPIVQIVLSTLLPRTVTYDKVEWQGGRILLHGLHFQDPDTQIHVDNAELSFHPQFKPLYLEMHLTLNHPEVLLSPNENTSTAFPLFLLQPRRFAGIKLHMNEGSLDLGCLVKSERYTFSFVSGEQKEEIGRFLLAESLERAPILQIDLNVEDGGLSASLATKKMPSERLFQLIDAFYSPLLQGWKGKEGEIEMQVGALFAPDFSLRAVSAQFSGETLNLFHPRLNVELQAKELNGKLFLPLFSANERLFSELIATVSIKGGAGSTFTSNDEKVEIIRKAEGYLAFEPGKEPTFHLQGTLCETKHDWPFVLSGKGEVKEEETFWTEVELSLGNNSPMNAQLSFCHPEKREYILQATVQEMSAQQLALFGNWLPTHLKEGTLGGKITARIRDRHLEQLLIEELKMHNLAFALSEGGSQGKIGILQAEGELSHSSHGWEFDHLDVYCNRVSIQSKALHLQEAEIHFSSLNHEIENLLVKGEVSGVKAQLLLEKVAEPESGLVGELVFGPANECKIEIGCDLVLKPFSSSQELTSIFHPKQGWLRAPTLSLSISNKLFKGAIQGIDLKGEVDLLGTFNEKGVELSLQSDLLTLHHPYADLELTHLGIKDPALLTRDGCMTVRYTFATQELFAEIPITEGKVLEKRQGVGLYNIQGECSLFAQLDETQETALHLKGKLHGAACHLSSAAKISDLQFEIEGNTRTQTLSLSSGKGVLNLQNPVVLPLTFSKITLQNEKWLRGEFDLVLRDEKQEALRLSGKIQEEKGGFRLFFDPTSAHFYQTKLANTQVLFNSTGKLLSLEGNFSILGKEFTEQLKLLKKCGFIHFDPTLVSCDGSLELALHYRDLFSFEIEGKRVRWKEHSFGYVSAKGSKRGEEWTLDQLKLDDLQFRGRLYFNKTRIAIPMFECKTLTTRIRGEGTYEEGKKQFNANLHEITCDLSKLDKTLSAKGEIRGKGRASFDFGTYQIQGEAHFELDLTEPLSLNAVSEKNILFSYNPKTGVQVKSAEFFLPEREMHLKAEQITVDGGMERAGVKKVQLSAASSLFGSTTWELKDLLFANEKGNWEARTATSFQNQPLFLKVAGQSSSSKRALIQISDSQQSEGLKLQGRMNGKWQWENISGTLAGLDVALVQSKKQSDALSGSVKIDLRRLSSFFPKEGKELVALLKLGKGYELVGEFFLPKKEKPHFQGRIVGQQFECLGFIFEELQANAQLSFDHVRLNQFSINDRGAHGEIKLVKIDRRSASGEWVLDAPLIQLHEVCPSLLRREKGSAGDARPLVIKNFSLHDLRGILNDASTLSARGHLNFTNASKREQSFLDIPIQFVKDLGLNPSMLVPVYGEIDLELRGSRFFVKDLRNAYSEAKRCQFFLSEEKPSFIDLSGNVHVDIKMKQNVTLKLVEPFTLKVRGTLEKPKLSI